MNYWLDVLGCAGICFIELLGIFITMILIQGLVYRTTRISIYNCIKNSIEKEICQTANHSTSLKH